MGAKIGRCGNSERFLFGHVASVPGVRIHSVCLTCASQQPLNQHVWISRGHVLLGLSGHACVTSVKSVRRAKRTYYVERVSRM